MLDLISRHDFFLRLAVIIAKAPPLYEVPIGAVLISPKGLIIYCSKNMTISLQDPTAHAEIICIRYAAKIQRSWRLSGYTIYTTLEPCNMCLYAAKTARISRIIWSHPETKYKQKAHYKNEEDIKTVLSKQHIIPEAENLLPLFFSDLRNKTK